MKKDLSVSQLSSAHSVEDERILHRMAKTAANYGFKSIFVVPHDGMFVCSDITFIACPKKTNKTNNRLVRFVALFCQFRWALCSNVGVFQIHDPDLLFVGLILKLFGRRVIYDVHDDYEASSRDRLRHHKIMQSWIPALWWFFERNVVAVFDGVVVADRYLEKKFLKCKPVVLGNYPRLDFTSEAHADDEETFNLIYVGGVTRERGLEMAFRALQLLTDPSLRLHIIGAGCDTTLLDMLRTDHRVILHGRVSWTELHRYYVKSHVGLALYQPLESFLYYPGENAVKVIEYMAAGIPVLCSDFPGLKTFTEGSGCGLVVKPNDPLAIAEKIQLLMDDPELRKSLGKRGRFLFETEYNWEKHEQKLVDLYHRILEA
ncbi:MAG: glycosyltransferase family 4 protein [Syntrophaceae bacterium]|nr:glycosyltransferase family 4 protein [Syntrophaceae bacterium]